MTYMGANRVLCYVHPEIMEERKMLNRETLEMVMTWVRDESSKFIEGCIYIYIYRFIEK